MPLLIAATDFSDVAKNATRYACDLAAAQHAEVMIIHSFMMPVVFSDIPMPTSIVTDTENDAELQMEKLLAELRATYPTLQINGKIFYGGTVEVIEEYAQEHNKPLLIIVGNNNAQEQDTWPDSTLYEALKELNYPVLAVPAAATYHGIDKVCFAFANEHSGIDAALTQLRDMVNLFGAALHVLNVRTDDYNPADDADIDATAKQILFSINPVYQIIPAQPDVDQAITAFTTTHGIDLLALIPHKHSFFQGLFHKGHTKAIAHHSHIPILAIH